MGLPRAFLDTARALVRADTSPGRGTRAAADLLAPLYEAIGLPVRRQEGDPGEVNLLAGPGGAGGSGADPSRTAVPGGVLLVTHIDTVPGGPVERWTETGGDPWSLTHKDGTLFGLGCADVKLDALCKIEAARRLGDRKLARPFWLVTTCGEEVGLRGARRFAKSPLFAEIRPRHVLCGEPSELRLITAHKGYAVVRCTVTDAKARLVSTAGPGIERLSFAGKAAHSSTPHLGVNAIRRALAWARSSGTPLLSASGGTSANVVPAGCVLEVPAPRDSGEPAPDEVRFLPATGLRPNLWRAAVTAGALEDLWLGLVGDLAPREDARFDPAGAVGGINVFESEGNPGNAGAVYGRAVARATLDARLLPQHDPDELLGRFQSKAQEWVRGLGAGELTIDVEVTRNAGGMSLRDDAELVTSIGRVLLRAGLDPRPRAKPTSTEAGVFARAGCEAVVIGPGRSTGNAHEPNERMEIAQLEKAIDLYEQILLELCG
jgi:acetylornithine deacetylase/succinyl-diaminopimelate desuccinylase-like protein